MAVQLGGVVGLPGTHVGAPSRHPPDELRWIADGKQVTAPVKLGRLSRRSFGRAQRERQVDLDRDHELGPRSGSLEIGDADFGGARPSETCNTPSVVPSGSWKWQAQPPLVGAGGDLDISTECATTSR
jgi:hypothetical protein